MNTERSTRQKYAERTNDLKEPKILFSRETTADKSESFEDQNNQHRMKHRQIYTERTNEQPPKEYRRVY